MWFEFQGRVKGAAIGACKSPMVPLVDSFEGISELPQYPISYLSSRKIYLPTASEDYNQVEDAKVTMPTTRSRSPQTSTHCVFYGLGVAKEDNTQGTIWNNAFLTERRKDTARSVSVVCVGLPRRLLPNDLHRA